MSWSDCGEDSGGRPIGYAHTATCDEPGCQKKIDRGLAYACGGMHGDAEYYCEKYFCGMHLTYCDYAKQFVCGECYAGNAVEGPKDQDHVPSCWTCGYEREARWFCPRCDDPNNEVIV